MCYFYLLRASFPAQSSAWGDIFVTAFFHWLLWGSDIWIQNFFWLISNWVWNSLFMGFLDFQLLFICDDSVSFEELIFDINSRNINIHLFLHSDKSQFPSSSIIWHKDYSLDGTIALCNKFGVGLCTVINPFFFITRGTKSQF